jgi:hypothetical protein
MAGHITTEKYRGRAYTALALLLVAIASFGPAASASAAPKLTADYTRFANCPLDNPEAWKCIYSTTIGGEVVLGSRKVPIVNPVVLRGAYAEPDKKNFSKFVGAADGQTLSAVPQPVPGGLLGIVSPEDSSPLVKALVAVLFENGLTKVSATLELAGPASAVQISENNLGGEINTALKLPVKVHLENAFLGPSCYIGSSSSPVIWNLSSGTTSPPKPAKPITGTVGEFEFLDEGRLIETKGTKLVDNAWATPAANGCGGPFSSLVNPLVNASAGLPAPAGVSTAILENEVFLAPTTVVAQATE